LAFKQIAALKKNALSLAKKQKHAEFLKQMAETQMAKAQAMVNRGNQVSQAQKNIATASVNINQAEALVKQNDLEGAKNLLALIPKINWSAAKELKGQYDALMAACSVSSAFRNEAASHLGRMKNLMKHLAERVKSMDPLKFSDIARIPDQNSAKQHFAYLMEQWNTHVVGNNGVVDSMGRVFEENATFWMRMSDAHSNNKTFKENADIAKKTLDQLAGRKQYFQQIGNDVMAAGVNGPKVKECTNTCHYAKLQIQVVNLWMQGVWTFDGTAPLTVEKYAGPLLSLFQASDAVAKKQIIEQFSATDPMFAKNNPIWQMKGQMAYDAVFKMVQQRHQEIGPVGNQNMGQNFYGQPQHGGFLLGGFGGQYVT
jgi:hypothetical protein